MKNYFEQEINKLLSLPTSSTLENEDPNKSVNIITKEQSNLIIQFIEQTFINQYTLYRGALFKNNPAYAQYRQFQKVTIIRFISSHMVCTKYEIILEVFRW